MQRSNNSAGQIDRPGQERSLRGALSFNHAQPRKQKGDHDGSEYFEVTFDPKMDHPPAPIFNHRNVRPHSPEKTRTIEQGDAGGRKEIKNHRSEEHTSELQSHSF